MYALSDYHALALIEKSKSVNHVAALRKLTVTEELLESLQGKQLLATAWKRECEIAWQVRPLGPLHSSSWRAF